LISEFFRTVRHVFQEDWDGKTPKTSRLVHGAGIIAMGYVMETIHVMTGAESREVHYSSVDALIASLDEKIIQPAEARFVELLKRKADTMGGEHV
jgi:hypothetical protein